MSQAMREGANFAVPIAHKMTDAGMKHPDPAEFYRGIALILAGAMAAHVGSFRAASILKDASETAKVAVDSGAVPK